MVIINNTKLVVVGGGGLNGLAAPKLQTSGTAKCNTFAVMSNQIFALIHKTGMIR